MLWILLACARDPYRDWPDPETVFPYVYTLETDLEPYEEVRWETETWTLQDDPELAILYLQKAVLHRPGAPVGIKKQVGPGLWVSTVARPGDTHYPVHP